jgi:hypothetical protein
LSPQFLAVTSNEYRPHPSWLQRFPTTPPMGFGSFRRNWPRRSLTCWITSPAPSVLRVSHSLNGLIPPELCGSISHHIHPQDFGLQSFPLSVSRSIFRCPFLSCCWTSSSAAQESRTLPLPPFSTPSSVLHRNPSTHPFFFCTTS